MPQATPLRQRRIHYGWIVAAVTFVVLLSSAGVRATPSILIVPLEREFGWTRATISLAISINLILYGLMGPFAAALMQRLGVRTTVLLSAATLVTGVALTPLVRAPWQLVLLWGVVVGVGTGMTALVLGATVVNRWFTERRGLVMGVLTASTATGQLIFLPLLAAVVQRYGWRAATLLVAGAVSLVIPLVLLFMRERPEEVGLTRYGEPNSGTTSEGARAPTSAGALAALRQGGHSRDFWPRRQLLHLRGQHQRADRHPSDPRLHRSWHSRGQGGGTPGSDGRVRFPRDHRIRLALGSLEQPLSPVLVLRSSRPLAPVSAVCADPHGAGPPLFAVFYGLDWIATVPPTVRLTSNAFGRENGPVMFGWIVAAHQLGAATAAYGAGALRTALGGYVEAFTIAGVLCFLAALMVLGIGRQRSARGLPAGQSVTVESFS